MRCEHEACVCEVTEGRFCSDHCRHNVSNIDSPCQCGHVDCDRHQEKKQTSPGVNDPVPG